MMKFIAVILAMWSFSAFSVEFLAGESRYTKGGGERFIHWHGTGWSVHDGEKSNYLVSLIYRAISANKFMIQVDMFSGDHHKSDRMVFVKVAGKSNFFKVYSNRQLDATQPTKADIAELAEALPESYQKSGWGFAEDDMVYVYGNGTISSLLYNHSSGELHSYGGNIEKNKRWKARLKQIFKR